ncbi:MAG: radical SAM protein [bacterium]
MPTKICNYFVTLRTNDQCEFCHLWEKWEEYEKIEEKPYDLALLQAVGVKDLNITGGEPLLRDDLIDILKQAKELGMKVQLTTNGLLYPDKGAQLTGLVDHLFIFLDYPNAEMHDRSRGVECYSEIIQAIRDSKKAGQKPIIKFTITRDSVMYLPEMLELAESLGVMLYLNPVSDFYGTQGMESATVDHLRYYWRKKNVLLNFAALKFVKYHGNRALLPRCKAQETTITIMPNGERVGPCFYNQNKAQGREDICSGCLRWDYMLPSLAHGLDKYVLLSQASKWLNKYKGVEL